ncbi:kinase-like protein, partial [Athelia psychrophila]
NLIGRRIDHGRFKLIDILGKGGYGVVYRALDTNSPATSPEYYAVKCLRKASAGPAQCSEVKLHVKLSSNPNILTIHRCFQDRNHIYLVMDLCTGGDLYRAVHGDKVPRAYHMDDAKTKTAILQSIDTVSACHDAGIFHRDIKLDNLVCDEGGLNIRLTDFGMSTRSTRMRVVGAGTHNYLAPECTEEQLGASYSTREADVWALGVLIFHLINGELPWDDASPNDPYFAKFLQNPDSLMRYNPMSRDAHEVLKKVFVGSVEERITLPKLRAEFEKLDTFY